MEVLANLARQVCAVGNQVKAWNQTIGKFRNRINRLEDELNNLPNPEDATTINPCANNDGTEEADAILVCDGGTEKIFSPSDDSLEILSCGGKWKTQPRGATLHFQEIATVVSVTTAVGTVTGTLPNYPEEACDKVWALFETSVGAGDGASGAAHSRTVKLGNYTLCSSGFHDTVDVQQAMAPVTSSSVSFTITDFGSSSGSTTIKLLGYLY